MIGTHAPAWLSPTVSQSSTVYSLDPSVPACHAMLILVILTSALETRSVSKINTFMRNHPMLADANPYRRRYLPTPWTASIG